MTLTLAVEYSQAEAAFREACAVAPDDPRPPLNLGRYLAKLSRPAEAIDEFYAAAVIDPEYFEEVKLGVGTARAQQGRLSEATLNFESASRMWPTRRLEPRARRSLCPLTVPAARSLLLGQEPEEREAEGVTAGNA